MSGLTEALALTRALRKHEPQIDYGYEEFKCSCGWDRDKRPRDAYMAHVQTAVLADLHAQGVVIFASREALTREVAEALHAEEIGCSELGEPRMGHATERWWDREKVAGAVVEEHGDDAAAIVARLLDGAS